MFYLFEEKNYVSSSRSIFYMEHSIYKYLYSVHDMVTAIALKHNHQCKCDDLLITIKTHIVPLLQHIADLEGILLRKSFYIVEHTCPHTQIDTISQISKMVFDSDLLEIKILLCDISKKLKQLCPNFNKIIDEIIESILHQETRRKRIFTFPYEWKKNNDPSKVWLEKDLNIC